MRFFLTGLAAVMLIGCSSTPTPAPSAAAPASNPSSTVSETPAAPASTTPPAPTSPPNGPGGTTTASGLTYKELKAGSGKSPKAMDMVTVNYRGTLTNGTEFDSSYKRNQPAQFPLNRVIPCWTEGVQMMKVGGKAQLTCPAAIAYGDRGSPPVIPPGATLIFEIELLDVASAP